MRTIDFLMDKGYEDIAAKYVIGDLNTCEAIFVHFA